jgi:calcium-dependent protein kinase
VLFAEDIQTGEYRAIREISKSVWRENKRFFREVDILKDFDHPNIVKVFGTIETPLNFYNIFEYLDGGDLKDLVRGIRNETALSRYIRDIVSALNYIHKQGFAHCNLSPSSILVTNDEEAVAKLTGLDFAQDLNEIEQPDYENMKLIYASPEFLKKEFEEKTDIWSLGVVVYELLVGKHPCCGRDTKEVLTEVVRGNIDFESTSFRTLSFNAQDFIKCTLQVDVMKRMSAFEALNHPWLAFSGKEHIINYDALMRLLTFKVVSN